MFRECVGGAGRHGRVYSHGRDKLFKRLGLVKTDTFWGSVGAILADTIYGFTLNLPGAVANYGLSGCGWPSMLLGIKASGAACWTSFIAGALCLTVLRRWTATIPR